MSKCLFQQLSCDEQRIYYSLRHSTSIGYTKWPPKRAVRLVSAAAAPKL